MTPTTYGVSALRITDGQEPHLLRYEATDDLTQLPELTAAFAADYADRDDVRIDVDTHH